MDGRTLAFQRCDLGILAGTVPGCFEVYTDKAGKTRFRLKAKNGQIIAVGEAYETHKACIAGVASVKKNAEDAKVVTADSGK